MYQKKQKKIRKENYNINHQLSVFSHALGCILLASIIQCYAEIPTFVRIRTQIADCKAMQAPLPVKPDNPGEQDDPLQTKAPETTRLRLDKVRLSNLDSLKQVSILNSETINDVAKIFSVADLIRSDRSLTDRMSTATKPLCVQHQYLTLRKWGLTR